MDIMELGAIGELVGGVAVVASLVYVGLQVRQSTQTTRAASHHATIDSLREWSLSIVEDNDVADLWLKGNADSTLLDERDQLKYTMLMFALLRIFETNFYQNQVGTGERKLLHSEELNMQWLFSNPGVQRWWRDQPFALDSDFAEYIESLLPSGADRSHGA